MTSPLRSDLRRPALAALAALVAIGSVGCTVAAVVLRLADPELDAGGTLGPDLVLGTIWPGLGPWSCAPSPATRSAGC